jgi:hypothetical protein
MRTWNKEQNVNDAASPRDKRDDETLSTATPRQGTEWEDPSDSTGLAGTQDPTDSSGLAGSGKSGTDSIYEVNVTVVTVDPVATGSTEDESNPTAERDPSSEP